MSTNRGIFDNFPAPSAPRPESPFEAYCEPTAAPMTATRMESPFTAADLAEEPDGFGFEAPTTILTPDSAPQPPAGNSPFSVEPPRGPSPATQAAIAAFGGRQNSAPSVPQVFTQPAPEASTPSPAAPVHVAEVAIGDADSDSFSIRQLELRAIFGVDRELTPDEIFDRCRALRGMRNVARVAPQDMATLEALKQLVPKLGFGSGSLKLYADSVPIEFIREGSVILAVQTEGGFAPGVRETLILVARELDRLQ